MKKNIIVWSIAVGLVAGLVLALIVVLTPVRRFPVGVVAQGDADAVLVTRFVDVAAERHFVERVAGGETRWSVETTPLVPAEGFDATALAIAGDRVVLAGTDGQGQDFALALALDDGALLWRAALPGRGGAELGGRLAARVLVDAERAYVLHDVVSASGLLADRLDVLALADGAPRWDLDDTAAGRLRFEARLRGGALVVSGAGAAALRLDPATGQRVGAFGFEVVVCEGPGGLVGQGGGALVWAPDGGPERRIGFPDEVDLTWTTTCGWRGGDIVMSVTRSFAPRLLRVTPTTGAIVWERALGLGLVMEGPLALGPELPRLLPVSVCGQDGEDAPNRCAVVVVDLDAGQVVARHATDRDEAPRPITTPERAYVWVRHAGVLVAVDATTGVLARALRFDRFVDLEPQLDDAAGLHLWLAPHLVAHPDDLPWVVFDLASGEVVRAAGDVRAQEVPPRLGEPDPTL